MTDRGHRTVQAASASENWEAWSHLMGFLGNWQDLNEGEARSSGWKGAGWDQECDPRGTGVAPIGWASGWRGQRGYPVDALG